MGEERRWGTAGGDWQQGSCVSEIVSTKEEEGRYQVKYTTQGKRVTLLAPRLARRDKGHWSLQPRVKDQ